MNLHSLPRRRLLALLPATALLAACGKRAPKARPIATGSTVLALGDSLTSGVGADAATAYPAVLQALTGWQVVNGGVSGDTTAQALARLPALLEAHRPQLVIVGIGGNDFLRQMSAAAAKDNIRAICRAATAAGAQVMLVAVPQFSLLAASTGRLADHPLYAELADELQLPLYGGGWAEVLGNARLRSDQVHANAQGYRQFAEGLAKRLRQAGLLA
ncbi:MAG: arylesterase [Comamonadaceae bacterium]|nr:arylesterase [Comamonadaceae bacterium]MBN9368329.1 arylesterase [Comamonadaceae bacterium]